ncbi:MULTISPECIES: aquaporin [unclassified Arthrobacter]|uniref:aquaporin n=1 Tax=Arthrobacter sp. Leaf234 TaxID=1736303 RepID=UPI0006FA1E17|nr:aquaporin [Arthrobacter sp. Leaf234]KQN97463.1 hypothetical protein ASF21_14360 [Arthrobacter sp. Leaf234]
MTQHSIAPDPESRASAHNTVQGRGNGSEGGSWRDGELRTPGLLARSVAEGVGSFFVILAGLGATMLATETSIQPSLVFGFAVVAAMIAFGHVSGGHFNPAITVGSAIAGRLRWGSVAPYVLAQVIGAVAASGLMWLALGANAQLTGIRTFFSSASNGFGEHSPAQFPLTSAFLLEVVATALLVAVFLGAGSRRARRDLAPFAVGLTVAGLLSFLLPVTNGALNPVRATASALFADPWALEQLWLFWAAPVIGGVIAGLVIRSTDAWGSPSITAGGAPESEGAADTADTAGTGGTAETARTADVAAAPAQDIHSGRNDAATFFDASDEGPDTASPRSSGPTR